VEVIPEVKLTSKPPRRCLGRPGWRAGSHRRGLWLARRFLDGLDADPMVRDLTIQSRSSVRRAENDVPHILGGQVSGSLADSGIAERDGVAIELAEQAE
jgi:hypothetical protein